MLAPSQIMVDHTMNCVSCGISSPHLSLTGNPRIAVDASQADVAAAGQDAASRPQMARHDVPDGRPVLRIDRSPAGDLVAFAGLERLLVAELQVGDAVADGLGRRADIG